MAARTFAAFSGSIGELRLKLSLFRSSLPLDSRGILFCGLLGLSGHRGFHTRDLLRIHARELRLQSLVGSLENAPAFLDGLRLGMSREVLGVSSTRKRRLGLLGCLRLGYLRVFSRLASCSGEMMVIGSLTASW